METLEDKILETKDSFIEKISSEYDLKRAGGLLAIISFIFLLAFGGQMNPTSVQEMEFIWSGSNISTDTPDRILGASTFTVYMNWSSGLVAGNNTFSLDSVDLRDGDLDVHNNSIKQINYTDFTPTTSIAYQEGRLYYDDAQKTLVYYNDESDVSVNLGEESIIRVKNAEGEVIENGEVVYISGSTGDNPRVKLARSDDLSTTRVFGMVTESSINNNAVGYITPFGRVRNLDTSAYSAGDTLYVSPDTAGAMTSVKPSQPNKSFRVGIVIRSHASEGMVFVDNGREIDNFDTGSVIFANGEGELTQDSVFTYNSTGDTLSVDTLDAGNEGDLNVNSSDYWGDLDAESDLTPSNFLTPGDYLSYSGDTLNTADNWVDESGDTMSGDLNMSGNNIDSADTMSTDTLNVSPFYGHETKALKTDRFNTLSGQFVPINEGKWVLIWRVCKNQSTEYCDTSEIHMAYSYDQGESLSGEKVIYDNDDDSDYRLHSTGMMNGRIGAMLSNYTGVEHADPVFLYSDDEGSTWSNKSLTSVPQMSPETRIMPYPSSAGGSDTDGFITYCMEGSSDGTGYGEEIYSLYTTDNGATWNSNVAIDAGNITGVNTISEAVVDRWGDNDKWLMVFRIQDPADQPFFVARSTDMTTWTDPVNSTLELDKNPLEIKYYGGKFYVYGTSRTFNGRGIGDYGDGILRTYADADTIWNDETAWESWETFIMEDNMLGYMSIFESAGRIFATYNNHYNMTTRENDLALITPNRGGEKPMFYEDEQGNLFAADYPFFFTANRNTTLEKKRSHELGVYTQDDWTNFDIYYDDGYAGGLWFGNKKESTGSIAGRWSLLSGSQYGDDGLRLYSYGLGDAAFYVNYTTGALDMNNNRIKNAHLDTSTLKANGLEENMVGFWGFEQNGQASSTQTAYDSSREGNDGTLGNSTSGDSSEPTWTAGKQGTALEFDGTDDYVDLPNTLNDDVLLGNFSYTIWVNSNEPATSNTFVVSTHRFTVLKVYDGSRWRFRFDNGTDDKYIYADREQGVWTHLTYTFNNKSKEFCGYKNGALLTCKTVSGSIKAQTGDFLLGTYVNGVGNYVPDAVMDEFRVYNRSLSSEEVQALYLGLGSQADGHLALK